MVGTPPSVVVGYIRKASKEKLTKNLQNEASNDEFGQFNIEKVMKQVRRYRKRVGRWVRLVQKFGKTCTSYANRSCVELLMEYFQYRRNVYRQYKNLTKNPNAAFVSTDINYLFS